MSLLGSIKNMIRGKAKEAEAALANPVRDAEFAIEDSEKDMEKYTACISKAMADIKLLKDEREGLTKKIETLSVVAERAFDMGNEADAEIALTEQSTLESQVAVMDTQIKRFEAEIVTQRAQLTKVRSRITDAKSKLTINKMKMKGVENRRALNAATSAHNHNNPLAKLDEFEKQIARADAEVDAEEELAGTNVSDIMDKYASSGPDISSKMAALRAKREAKATSQRKFNYKNGGLRSPFFITWRLQPESNHG